MTKPIDDLLPLPMAPQAEPFMNLYHEAIHEQVCFGTHILLWYLEQGKSDVKHRDEISMAIPLLFRHVLELIDAISAQVKLGIVTPCKIQLRALLEAYMSLEYMLEKDRQRRSACFLITDHYRKLNFHRGLAPNTPENEKLMAELKEFGVFMSNFTPINAATKTVKNLESLIALPIYDEAREEYLKKTNQNKKNLELKWYSLFDGPSNIHWLTKRLKKYDFYEFFYRAWSNPTHGTDLSTKVLVKGEDGMGAITQLRNMEEAHEVVTQTIMFTLMIFDLMSVKVVSEHRKEVAEWSLWYRDTYRNPVAQNKIHFK